MNSTRLLIMYVVATMQLAAAPPLTWAQDDPFDDGPGQELVGPELHGGQRRGGEHDPKHGSEHGPGKFREKLQKELNLSDEQRQALNGLRENRKQNRELQMKVMQQRKELNDALRSGLFSEDQVLERVKQINESSAQLNTGRVQNIIALKKTLRPEQLSKLRDFMQQHRQQRQERMQQFREGRGQQGFGRDDQGVSGFGQKRRPHGQSTQRGGFGKPRGDLRAQ